jgi:hypothetical protein
VHVHLVGEPAVLFGSREALGRRETQGGVGRNFGEAVAANGG